MVFFLFHFLVYFCELCTTCSPFARNFLFGGENVQIKRRWNFVYQLLLDFNGMWSFCYRFLMKLFVIKNGIAFCVNSNLNSSITLICFEGGCIYFCVSLCFYYSFIDTIGSMTNIGGNTRFITVGKYSILNTTRSHTIASK